MFFDTERESSALYEDEFVLGIFLRPVWDASYKLRDVDEAHGASLRARALIALWRVMHLIRRRSV